MDRVEMVELLDAEELILRSDGEWLRLGMIF
jgi:hypothetical protein